MNNNKSSLGLCYCGMPNTYKACILISSHIRTIPDQLMVECARLVEIIYKKPSIELQ